MVVRRGHTNKEREAYDMGADQVTIKGRFKDEKGRYEEIQEKLIRGLSKHLDPEDIWKNLFELKEGYLELYIDDTFGNWGRAKEYIEKDFIVNYQDVLLEFCCIEYYRPDVSAAKVIYDGKEKKCTWHHYAEECEFEDEFEDELEDEEFEEEVEDKKTYEDFEREIEYQLIK